MKPAITNFALSLGAILVFLGLFEAYLWQRYEREYDRLEARYEGRELCTRAASDPGLIYEITPNACGFNSLGFADIEHAYAKPSTSYRIVVIGDSVAQGQGVPRDKRFDSVLAERLIAAGRQNVEIINLARTGYSTSQELLILRRFGIAYEPDLIIWSYVLNDPAHPIFHDANGQLGQYFHRPAWRTRHYIEKKLFQARENAMHDTCGTEFHVLLHCAYREEIVDHLGQLGDLAKANVIPIIFAIHPVFEETGGFHDYAFAAVHEDLDAIARNAGLQVVDLVEAYRSITEPLRQDHVDGWYDPWHPNELGHRLIAERLFEALQVTSDEN